MVPPRFLTYFSQEQTPEILEVANYVCSDDSRRLGCLYHTALTCESATVLVSALRTWDVAVAIMKQVEWEIRMG